MLDGLQGRFYYTATMAKDFKLLFLCAYEDAIAIVLQPKWRSCTDAALVFCFETASMYISGQLGFSITWSPAFEQDI